jgi:hypothetical protein
MEHRARIRTQLRRVGITAALAALLVPAAAGTADAAKHKKHSAKLPVITKVKPMRAAIGDTLTITGKNFRRGVNKNTVIFMRDGGRPVFVKAAIGTTKLLKVKLTATLARALRTKSGVPVATRFRLRVLAGKFGRAFTTTRLSPIIDPEKAPSTNKPPVSAPDADCDGDGVTNRNDADDDNDLLPDTLEAGLKTDPCKADSDGDGVPDGYEYRSALDLNDDEYQNKSTVPANDVLPYPGKRPYPNALDPTDANNDYDGDGLTLDEEYGLWQYTMSSEGAPYDLSKLTYSDGTQYSLYYRDANGRRRPSQPWSTYDKHNQFVSWATANGYSDILIPVRDRLAWNDPTSPITEQTFSIFDVNLDGTPDSSSYDYDGDGYVSDDERDEDADGLSNFDETHGSLNPSFWTSCYTSEPPYLIKYAGTSVTDPDADGDGVRDGADDQDFDGFPNIMELSRTAASGRFDGKGPCIAPDPPAGQSPVYSNHPNLYGQINPFNPCLPATWSRTCIRHRGFDGQPAPFKEEWDWLALN